MKKMLWFIPALLIFSGSVFAQQGQGGNNTCETAAPFCTGTVYNFPAGVNAGAGQVGPYYACLQTRPNPAWYYMKVALSGNIIIQMHSEPAEDIDFCCWGPFPSQECCGLLTSNKVVDCSYSPQPTETCDILNAVTGQYYMLVITNYSNDPCNIIFQQTSGTGTTDCSILPPTCTSNSPICIGQTLQLTAQSVTGATYYWWGPAGFTSNIQNPTIPNATIANAGEYYLRIVVNGQTSIDTSDVHVDVYHPVANAGNDTTIMNGVTATLHGSCTAGSGAYHYKWTPADKLVNDSIQNPQTVNLFTAQVFTLKVTDDSAGCQATDLVTVNIQGGPLSVNAVATPSSICFGSSTQLQAIGSGGAGNYTYQWTGPNGFTSTLPNPTVVPDMTSTYQVTAFDGYNTVNGTVTVTIIPLPVANAGQSKSIPNGTYTFLDGSVTNGNSTYYYSWSPADKLIHPGIQNPRTVNLSSNTLYFLQVTDLSTNCISTNEANVLVEVTGVALNVNPVAAHDSICPGDSTRLYAVPGGGNVGHYNYSWSSIPPGFTSSEADPMVSPRENTTYQISLFDQFNTIQGSVNVILFQKPAIHLGPADSTVCIYDTVELDAGNPGSDYLWSNGAITGTISFGTTGIGYDAQTYSVVVTNRHGCRSDAAITVIFATDACTGIGENGDGGRITLYPNPAR
ncbi:MAG TPA: hypothetical protein PLK82_12495, partial [Bacteroidales bacterium]|nr:hypothetical protein [Bacteroidales bacterium]